MSPATRSARSFQPSEEQVNDSWDLFSEMLKVMPVGFDDELTLETFRKLPKWRRVDDEYPSNMTLYEALGVTLQMSRFQTDPARKRAYMEKVSWLSFEETDFSRFLIRAHVAAKAIRSNDTLTPEGLPVHISEATLEMVFGKRTSEMLHKNKHPAAQPEVSDLAEREFVQQEEAGLSGAEECTAPSRKMGEIAKAVPVDQEVQESPAANYSEGSTTNFSLINLESDTGERDQESSIVNQTWWRTVLSKLPSYGKFGSWR